MQKLSYFVMAGTIATCAYAQTSSSKAPASNYPMRTVQFGSPTLTTLGSRGTVMTNLTGCSDDGVAFALIMDDPDTAELVLHSIQADGKSIPYHLTRLSGYKDITMARRFFSGNRYVATLVDARPDNGPAGQIAAPFISLVLIYDRDGEFRRAVPVPADVNVQGIGVFDSGDVLLVGMDPATKAAKLTVVSQSGEPAHSFPLFDNDFNTAPDAAKKQPLMHTLQGGGLDLVQAVAHDGNLLLVPGGTAQPMVEVSESGVVRSYDAHLPAGLVFETLLNTDGTTWYVKTYGDIWVHDGGASMQEGPLFGINPADGSIRVELSPPVKATPRIVCEHASEFLGVTTDRDSGRLEVESGSIPQ